MRLESVKLVNFRSFRDVNEIDLAPITLLVGENSAGKTGFLAALSAFNTTLIPSLETLNLEPYRLAGFRSLASDGEKRFGLGYTVNLRVPGLNENVRLVSTTFFHPNRLKPAQVAHELKVGDGLSISFANDKVEVVETGPDESVPLTKSSTSAARIFGLIRYRGTERFPALLDYLRFGFPGISLSEDAKKLVQRVSMALYEEESDSPFSISPIRSKPQRHYEGTSSGRTPEGEDAPHRLRELLRKRTSEADRRETIAKFGQRSGLFDNLRARELRTASGDSFELTVDSYGRTRTLVDVGYGVSQVLPVITDVALAPSGSLFLIQQPEVHLHPKSQAELGSFFADQWVSQRKSFVIETHSDYIVDRLRVEVKRGKVSHEDLSILFLQNQGEGTTITKIMLDPDGDFINAPEEFRGFFLQEQRSLFGWDS